MSSVSASNTRHRRKARLRVWGAVVFVIALAAAGFVVSQAIGTLDVLTQVERERDVWQRPSDVLAALDLRPGSVVADVGAGAGYFALKMAPLVGPQGRVLAVDVRRLSLSFLWIRAFRQGSHNLEVIHGEVDNPRLPPAIVDAALIANTYHELANPGAILAALHRSIKTGGRVVIVDRSPRPGMHLSREEALDHHERLIADVEEEMHLAGFDTISRDDRFIDRPEDDHVWWLLVMRTTLQLSVSRCTERPACPAWGATLG